jgi:hypothetical protein
MRSLLPLLCERSMQPNEEPGDDARRMSCERSAPWGASSTAGPLRRDTSSGTGLLKPHHELLDFAGACFSEASFIRDDAKAALLEDAVRRDVVKGNACVEWARRINGQEHLEGAGCDPPAPVGPADPW